MEVIPSLTPGAVIILKVVILSTAVLRVQTLKQMHTLETLYSLSVDQVTN